jgi:methyltransferase (TIGR00027 family)
MAKQSVSRTALGAAICRLIEQYQPRPTRLFDDPVAQALVGRLLSRLMQAAAMRNLTVQQTEAVARGIYGTQICRTRYIDDAVRAALAQGMQQVVLLGAGYDTRPYRLPQLATIKVFEVDLPTVQRSKQQRLQKYLGRLPDNVTFVPIDFDTQHLDAVMAGTPFSATLPTLFVWEGVTQYLTAPAVRQTLALVGAGAPGTTLVFTYVLKSVIERRSNIPDAAHMMDVVANQAPWIFGLEPDHMAAFLAPFHLRLADDVGNRDYQERYLKPLGRQLVVTEAERVAQAVVER